MHKKFLNLLCCPYSGSELELEVIEYFPFNFEMVKSGRLFVKDHNELEYPIIQGIPRFVKNENYSESFGFEWKKWSRIQFETENSNLAMRGHTSKMFTSVTNLDNDDLKGKITIEFGCGPGRFLELVRKSGGIAVGIDMSLAVESARENFLTDEDVLIVQGDILQPPFKAMQFDIGYTIGVLHHTPFPIKGFEKLALMVKPDGKLSCLVYPKKGFYDFPSVSQ
jgi:SAM-dependent methyltransferase